MPARVLPSLGKLWRSHCSQERLPNRGCPDHAILMLYQDLWHERQRHRVTFYSLPVAQSQCLPHGHRFWQGHREDRVTESSWGLAPSEDRRGHWWRCRLRSSWTSSIERVMKKSWGFVPWREPRRGCGWRCSPVSVEAPAWWRCQYHGTLSSKNSGSGEWHWPKLQRLCSVSYKEQSWRSDPNPLEEPKRLWANPRYWTLIYLYFWSVVLLCSDCDCPLVLLSCSKKIFNLLLIL